MQKLVEDLVGLADGDVDFSRYDNDGDGYVDGLIVVPADNDAYAWGRFPQPFAWALDTPVTKDGVKIWSFMQASDKRELEVYCHEFGHLLGLPDLYDRDYGSYGLGNWDLMAYGEFVGPPYLPIPAGPLVSHGTRLADSGQRHGQ